MRESGVGEYSFEDGPRVIELLQGPHHFLANVRETLSGAIVADSNVDVSAGLLDVCERVEKALGAIKDFLSEVILAAIYPEERISFLSGVQYFRQIAKRSFFVEYFVGIREVVSVVPRVCFGFKTLKSSANLSSPVSEVRPDSQ